MSTTTLVQLPPELLCHVLTFLDSYNLVRVRKDASHYLFKEIVDDSEMLQYLIDLDYFQMIPVGSSEMDASPATRRKRLRLYDDAWQRVEYNLQCTFPSSMLGQIYAFWGGIYSSAGENCIRFARLPSASDSLYYWSHPVDITTVVAVAFCAVQDLLIVVSHPSDLQSHVYDVHLRSLTTNDTHPDAAQPFLKALDKDNIGGRIFDFMDYVKVQIIGNYIIMLCQEVTGNMGNTLDCMQLWDWKCEKGYQFNLLFDRSVSDFSFITEDKFLVCVASGTMELYSITNKSKPPQCTAKLSLPSLMDGFSYIGMFTSDNPTPGSMFPYSRNSSQKPSCSFHPTTDDQVIAILVSLTSGINTNNSLSSSCRFVARLSAILELEGLFARTYGQSSLNGPRLPWSMWGPQHATWLQVHQSRCWQPPQYGFRTVEFINENPYYPLDEPRRPLCIRDFNPHIACNYSAVDKSGWRGRIVRGEVDRVVSRPFTEPLGSALTYREVFSEGLFDVAEMLMDESRILLVKASHNLQSVPSTDGIG
ncbi:hypothetical protein F4604DRAFT_1646062 [Suillus subluteus]|nr:hypothetical protein F4604DRAFT_1646062 [Suillus subluteus]